MFSVKDTGKDEPTVKDTPVKKANETTPADIALAGLVESCNEEEAKYQKLYLEYGLVVCKEDIDKNGQKLVRLLIFESFNILKKIRWGFLRRCWRKKHWLSHDIVRKITQLWLWKAWKDDMTLFLERSACGISRKIHLQSSTSLFDKSEITCGDSNLSNSNFYLDTVTQEKEARDDRSKHEEKEKYQVVSFSLHILMQIY